MEFLGITGLMDRLREDVPNTIKKLLVAGISVWIATGKIYLILIEITYIF